VVAITQGEAIANVELDANGQRLVSSITIEAVNELGISEGTAVVAVVKASDVMIAIEE
jgi:molybdopterin-binding protein